MQIKPLLVLFLWFFFALFEGSFIGNVGLLLFFLF